MPQAFTFDRSSTDAIARTVREHQAALKNGEQPPLTMRDRSIGQQVFIGVTTVNSEYPSYPSNTAGNDTFVVAVTHSIHDEIVPTSDLESHDLGNYVYAKQIDGEWVAQSTRVIVFSVPTAFGPRWWFLTAPSFSTSTTGCIYHADITETLVLNTAIYPLDGGGGTLTTMGDSAGFEIDEDSGPLLGTHVLKCTSAGVYSIRVANQMSAGKMGAVGGASSARETLWNLFRYNSSGVNQTNTTPGFLYYFHPRPDDGDTISTNASTQFSTVWEFDVDDQLLLKYTNTRLWYAASGSGTSASFEDFWVELKKW